MVNTTHKGRATTLSKALLTAGLLSAAALSTLGAGAALAVSPPPNPAWGSFSNGVTGQKFYYSGGPLTVIDLPATSGFNNFIYLASPGYPPTQLSYLLTDSSLATVVLSAVQVDALGISPGDELVFAIIPNSGIAGDIPPNGPPLPAFPSTSPFITGQPASYIMFSGDSTRNGDGLYHAAVYTGFGPNAGQFIMGFEDIYGGGDLDYDDAAFRATSGFVTQESVPGPLPLLGVGAAFGFSRKLRKRIKPSKTPDVLSIIG
jgi:hypothetical protein